MEERVGHDLCWMMDGYNWTTSHGEGRIQHEQDGSLIHKMEHVFLVIIKRGQRPVVESFTKLLGDAENFSTTLSEYCPNKMIKYSKYITYF